MEEGKTENDTAPQSIENSAAHSLLQSLVPSTKEPDTFITQNKETGKYEYYNPKDVEINGLYGQINGCIDILDDKVADLLKKHEIDFLKAYKEQMYAVQKEMRLLQDQANEEECKKRREEYIEELEEHRDQYRNEAVKLDKICKEYKKSVEVWKAKVETQDDDQAFLEEQIMQAKMQNLALTDQLNALDRGQEDRNYNALAPEPSNEGSIGPDVAEDRAQVIYVDSHQSRLGQSSSYSGLHTSTNSQSNMLTKQQSAKDFGQMEKRYKETIGHIKNQLDMEKKNIKQLKTAKQNYMLEKGELEEFFNKWIEEVKEDIKKRRVKQTKLQTRSVRTLPKVQSDRYFGNADRDIRFENFTDTDKRKVMELLISDERVLWFLYERLFPQKPEGPPKPTQITSLRNLGKSSSVTGLRKPQSSNMLRDHQMSTPNFKGSRGMRPRTEPEKPKVRAISHL